MRMNYFHAFLSLAAAVTVVGGCQTATFSSGARQNKANETARTEMRIEALEMQIQQLSLKVEEFERTQQYVRESLEEQRHETLTLREQLERAKLESSEVKSGMDALRGEQARISKSVQELPARITSVVGSASSTASTSSSHGSGEYYEHIVERGQTVSDIAKAYNVRAFDIVRENKLGEKAMIRVGQKLLIPKE